MHKEVILISHGFQTNYERGFTNGLASNGVCATLIGSDRTDVSGLMPNVRVVNLRGSQEESRSRYAKAFNLVRYHIALMVYAVRRRSAIVHVIGLVEPVMLCGIVEGLCFRLVSKRYVLTIHNLLPHGRHSKINMILFGWAFRLPHRLVVHTDRARDELVTRYDLSPSRIIVMEHGIEPVREPVDPLQRRDNGSDLNLLFFGYVAPYKGLDVLLRALPLLPFPFRLTIAGSCKDVRYRKEILSLIDATPHSTSISWMDRFLNDDEVKECFLQADVLVMPYRHIDQSGVLFQALRYGVPIVATRVGQLEKYVSHGIGEVCAANDERALGEAIMRLWRRKDAFSRETIRAIGATFEWKRTVAVLHSAYM